MACNVFGTPVTIETLKGMPEYADKETITRSDLADVALSLKNAEGKDVSARSYVESMYKRFDGLHCALVLIYNATGELLRYVGTVDMHSFVGPAPVPIYIENGQWGAFLSVTKNKNQTEGSVGSVVYRGYKFDGSEVDFFVAWDSGVRKVVVESNDILTYTQNKKDQLLDKVNKAGHYSWETKDNFLSTAVIGGDNMSVLEVIHRLTLPNPIVGSQFISTPRGVVPLDG